MLLIDTFIKKLKIMKKKVTLFLLLVLFASTTMAQNWEGVGSQGFDSQVLCLLTDPSSNVLYAGGAFKKVDGTTVNGIAKWDGSSWSALGDGFSGTNAVVYSLALYNGDLYAGGHFTKSGSTTVNNIAKWDGNAWVPVGTGTSTSGSYDFVGAMLEFNGTLYIGGEFSTAGGNNISNIATWNGTTWAGVQAGANGRVNDFYMHNNELYTGGGFFFNNGSSILQYRIAKIVGNIMQNVGTLGLGDATSAWSVHSMATYKNNLYAGGNFNVIEGTTTTANHIAMWNGSQWSTLGTGKVGVTSTSSFSIRALEVYDDLLFVGGNFTAAGNENSNNLATWDGTTWKDAGAQLDGGVNAMTVYGNALIVAGTFKNAGGKTVNHIVKYGMPTTVEGINNVEQVKTTISPNPSKGNVVVHIYSNKKITNATLDIYNVAGALVKRVGTINERKVSVDNSNTPSGIYFYKLRQNGVVISNGKMVIE